MKRCFFFGIYLLTSSHLLSLPNPSAQYCLNNGGFYDTRADREGNQDGVCLFKTNGIESECGGWAFFKGTCAQGSCKRWSVDSNTCLEALSAT